MPTQKGRLWILVFPGKTTSVGTGDGNQVGANSLWVRFPPDRMLVAPSEFTVTEGGADGGFFLVVLTSERTDTVRVTVSGMAGTEVEVIPQTLTVVPRFWNSGRGMTVTAGSDANSADETVRLTVRASGGGYDGRTARVVVKVKDSGGGFVQGMSEDEALTLVDDLTPGAAAAALFGEGDLSDARPRVCWVWSRPDAAGEPADESGEGQAKRADPFEAGVSAAAPGGPGSARYCCLPQPWPGGAPTMSSGQRSRKRIPVT